ncbi:hypothetical protein EVAR_69793_1 [Eumeta japonica]|uniref:Uncharacterized protein n=1 Tax=Eumeta variegata TaxID=151549 RepID=A0A4C2ABW7_EUMVA|nr:hypothetical protein EVAR_69793_1 [Eumeta japonica]
MRKLALIIEYNASSWRIAIMKSIRCNVGVRDPGSYLSLGAFVVGVVSLAQLRFGACRDRSWLDGLKYYHFNFALAINTPPGHFSNVSSGCNVTMRFWLSGD